MIRILESVFESQDTEEYENKFRIEESIFSESIMKSISENPENTD